MIARLRHAEAQDHAHIAAVIDAWWGGRPMRLLLPRLFFEHFRDTSFIAEDDGGLAGFLVGFLSQSHDDVAYVHFIGVRPDLRGAGLGRTLYDRFFDVARSRGRRAVRCITSPVNRASVAFHTRLGFAIVPGDGEVEGIPVHRNHDGAGGDRVVFERAL